MMRYLLLAAGITGVVVLGVLIDSQSRSPAVRPQEPAEQLAISAPGRVEGASPEIELRTRLAGRIVRLFVQEGQFVEKGDVLLQLDDAEYRHETALAAAELELATAQLDRLLNGARSQERSEAKALYQAKLATLKQAQVTWQRIHELIVAKAISQQRADDQRGLVEMLSAEVAAAKARVELIEAPARADEVRISRARIQAAQARLDLAGVPLQQAQLQAPQRGQILKVHVETGELTGPTSADPAIVLADTSRFQVRAFVDELDAPRVQLGASARITVDGIPGKELKGRVIRLSPRMDRKLLFSNDPTERRDTKTREVWIELHEADGLVIGLRVDVMIDVASAGEEAHLSVLTGDAKPVEDILP